jgi:hypothetical protein
VPAFGKVPQVFDDRGVFEDAATVVAQAIELRQDGGVGFRNGSIGSAAEANLTGTNQMRAQVISCRRDAVTSPSASRCVRLYQSRGPVRIKATAIPSQEGEVVVTPGMMMLLLATASE